MATTSNETERRDVQPVIDSLVNISAAHGHKELVNPLYNLSMEIRFLYQDPISAENLKEAKEAHKTLADLAAPLAEAISDAGILIDRRERELNDAQQDL